MVTASNAPAEARRKAAESSRRCGQRLSRPRHTRGQRPSGPGGLKHGLAPRDRARTRKETRKKGRKRAGKQAQDRKGRGAGRFGVAKPELCQKWGRVSIDKSGEWLQPPVGGPGAGARRAASPPCAKKRV